MAIRHEEIDKGANRIIREMRRLENSFTTIGVHKSAGKYTGAKKNPTVAQVAAWNEFGTKTSPARPFMRSAIDTGLKKINRRTIEEFRAVSDGRRTAKLALDRLGFLIQTMVQGRIQKSNSWAKANAPSTRRQKRKGGAARGPTPLIWTLLMHNSITFKTTIRGKK